MVEGDNKQTMDVLKQIALDWANNASYTQESKNMEKKRQKLFFCTNIFDFCLFLDVLDGKEDKIFNS